MLLGSTANTNTASGTESLVILLFLQQRYAEVYELLSNQKSAQTSVRYNKALCLHWSGNYQGALSQLDGINLAPQLNNSSNLGDNNDIEVIRSKQNKTDDYLQAITEAYALCFPALVHDLVVRLKTNCWLQLGNYAKVVAIATPIANKGYKNITDALNLAGTYNAQRI